MSSSSRNTNSLAAFRSFIHFYGTSTKRLLAFVKENAFQWQGHLSIAGHSNTRVMYIRMRVFGLLSVSAAPKSNWTLDVFAVILNSVRENGFLSCPATVSPRIFLCRPSSRDAVSQAHRWPGWGVEVHTMCARQISRTGVYVCIPTKHF